MPIALLKFPSDLLREVFKLCEPFELYKLSKCSKRAQRSKKLGGPKNWKIRFSSRRHVIICVDDSNYSFEQTKNPNEYFKIEYSRMCIEFPNGEAVDMFVYLLETFGIRTVESLGCDYGNFHDFSKIARFLIGRNMEIESFWIGAMKYDAFMPLMNQMNITKDFTSFFKFPSDFRLQLTKYPNKICIYYSFWYNIGQLLECTCVRIELLGSKMRNRDLNVFLKKWKKRGTFPNLRLLKVDGNNIDDRSPILGSKPPIKNVDNPTIRVSFGNEEIDDAIRVMKADGTVGWLNVKLGDVPTLKFLVANPTDTVVKDLAEDEDLEDDW
ncbi:hypothetical protein B9Z55_012804 [Caenorhabditis nigoni]|uniref:F-box domain-containing protein n=1 Tax=Caenorhabditis nigoni TaxID=1611254 RepID=A0A2G5TYZ5_9PELO|nr:hypothetical protein B9Z55_012804 [Caenorhabditis nigoni]